MTATLSLEPCCSPESPDVTFFILWPMNERFSCLASSFGQLYWPADSPFTSAPASIEFAPAADWQSSR